VIKKWDSPPISGMNSLHQVGKEILEKLLYFKEPLHRVPVGERTIKMHSHPTRDRIFPTTKLVTRDLMAAGEHNVTDFLNRRVEYGVSGEDVIASILNPFTDCKMDTPERRLYGALDIVMTANGLGACNYKAGGYQDREEHLIDKKLWTSTLTPSGAITHTHMDFYGRHQYMVHLFGHKIWLLWPPTDSNLEKYRVFHTQIPKENSTLHFIDELEGLELFYGTEEQVFVLQPNTLHACICVRLSAHTGTWVWSMGSFEKSAEMISWGLEWIRGKVCRDEHFDDQKGELLVVEQELKAWKELIKRKGSWEGEKLVKDRLGGLEKEYEKTKNMFKKSVKKKK
jgi:hypothetical protein